MDVKIKFDKRKFITQAEDVADTALRYSRKYLPVAARVCLLSMQLEDGFRFLFISDRIAEFHARNWNAPYGLMIFLNYLRCILQIAATVVCILRIKVEICVGILYGTMLLYCLIARIFSIYYFLRLAPIAGGMLLLLVENQPEAKNIFNGLPVLEESTPHSKIKDALQLLGRGLVALNFIYTVLFQQWTILATITTAVGAVLVGLVLIGYKTKLSAITLITYLVLSNLYSNFFFLIDWDSNLFTYYRYLFFQNMTVVGGLLFIVAVGPGGVSLDEKKKNW